MKFNIDRRINISITFNEEELRNLLVILEEHIQRSNKYVTQETSQTSFANILHEELVNHL